MLYAVLLLLEVVNLSQQSDPFRWVLSHGKPAIQSSTDGNHVPSYVTDGDYNNFVNPLIYSLTMKEENPYLQIDLGKSVNIAYIYMSIPSESGLNSHSKLQLTLGDDPNVESTTNSVLTSNTYVNQWRLLIFLPHIKKGRYLTIRKIDTNVKLFFTEVAAFTTPIENLAFMKNIVGTPPLVEGYGPDKVVDMELNSPYDSSYEQPTWIRVDLAAVYLIAEVVIYSRFHCCANKRLIGFDLRIGNSLENEGNFNVLCATIDLYPGAIRSYYCRMFGRYINIYRKKDPAERFSFAEIVVNPETTENIASSKTTYTNTVPVPGQQGARSITDTAIRTCYSSQVQSQSKRVWIDLANDYNIAMVHIVNHPDFLEHTVDFEITVGMSNNPSLSAPCVPGLQTMAGIHFASLFCDQRITGNHVFLLQQPEDKQISICEIGVFEETKPKILDMKRDQLIWEKEGSDLDLTCNAKGYPVPVLTWVKDNETIQSNSDTLQLTNAEVNHSGIYECWAKNIHGVDAKSFYVTVSGDDIRLCVKYSEIKYTVGTKNDRFELKGNEWYKFFDLKNLKELEFQKSPPKRKHSSCLVWLSGVHPKANDGVVKRQLCIRNVTHECSRKIDIFIRRCSTHYIYNFRNMDITTDYPFCFQDIEDVHGGFQPAIASLTRKHVLLENIIQTEQYMSDSHDCLKLCQLALSCKSFNYSKKLKKCELNNATKKEIPEKYVASSDFDYYKMGKGSIMTTKQEL